MKRVGVMAPAGVHGIGGHHRHPLGWLADGREQPAQNQLVAEIPMSVGTVDDHSAVAPEAHLGTPCSASRWTACAYARDRIAMVGMPATQIPATAPEAPNSYASGNPTATVTAAPAQ